MADFVMDVYTEYGLQTREIIGFTPEGAAAGKRRPVPLLLNGENVIHAPGGGIVIVKTRYRKRNG